MIVTCEKCNTSFELDDGLVEEPGSEVKCSECQHVFTVQKPDAAEEPEVVLDFEEEPTDLPGAEEEPAEEVPPVTEEEPAKAEKPEPKKRTKKSEKDKDKDED